MAPTGFTDVDAYVASLPPVAAAYTSELRQLIRDADPDITESIRYNMPCFQVDGTYVVHVGAWKKHVGLYPVPRLPHDLEAEVAAYRAAKDTVRLPYDRPLPRSMVERLIGALIEHRTTASSPGG